MSKEHDGGLWIRPEIWAIQSLSATEKCLLAKIDNLDKSESGCYASNEHLGDFIGLSAGRVANMICDLKKRGFIDQYFFDGKNRKLRLYENKLHENVKDKVKKPSRKRENFNESVKVINSEASQIRERSFTNSCENLHENVSEASQIREHNKEYIRDNKEIIERAQTPEIEIFPLETKTDQKETPSAVKVITSKTQLTNAELESDFAFVIAADIFWLYLEQNEGQLDMMKLNTRFSGSNEEVKELVYKFFADKADQNFVLRTPCQRSNIGAITKWMSNQKTFKQPIDPKIVPIQPKRAGQLTNYQTQNQNDLDNGDYVTLSNGTKVTRTQYNRVMARHAPPVSG